MPVGPPQNGMLGLTFDTSLPATLTSAKSLNEQTTGSLVPIRFMVSQEL